MAHPKRTLLQDATKTYTLQNGSPNVITCKVTGESHLSHRAYVSGNDLYYNGKSINRRIRKNNLRRIEMRFEREKKLSRLLSYISKYI